MKTNQLTRGHERRLMYVENKDVLIDGSPARIGWVRFSKSGRSVFYRGRTLKAIGGSGIRGNFRDEESGEEYWVSGVKKRGSNVHAAESASVAVDDDASVEYQRLRERAGRGLMSLNPIVSLLKSSSTDKLALCGS